MGSIWNYHWLKKHRPSNSLMHLRNNCSHSCNYLSSKYNFKLFNSKQNNNKISRKIQLHFIKSYRHLFLHQIITVNNEEVIQFFNEHSRLFFLSCCLFRESILISVISMSFEIESLSLCDAHRIADFVHIQFLCFVCFGICHRRRTL